MQEQEEDKKKDKGLNKYQVLVLFFLANIVFSITYLLTNYIQLHPPSLYDIILQQLFFSSMGLIISLLLWGFDI